MRLKEASPSRLFDRHDRAVAKLARIARVDTIHGGARALVLERRLIAMGSDVPDTGVVSSVYGASNYSCGEFGAYECPECGTAHLGTERAYACCSQQEEEEMELV